MVFKKGNVPWNKGTHGLQTHTDERKAEASVRMKGNTYSEGTIPWNKGKTDIYSQETLDAIGAAHKGKTLSTNQIKDLSERMKGNTHRKGKPPWNKGIPLSDETKLKISSALKGKQSWLGREHTEETIKKMSMENHHNWKGGISFEPYCNKFNDKLKETIRNRDDRTCQLCGCDESEYKHSVHHIHYDKENCEPDLITLCRACNAKVNFNRDYWEGFFMNILKEKGFV